MVLLFFFARVAYRHEPYHDELFLVAFPVTGTVPPKMDPTLNAPLVV